MTGLALAGLWLGWGCGTGPTHPSLIKDTRVISIIAEPPEAGPGEGVQVTATVIDPQERGADVLVWTCGLYEGRCIEEALFADDPAGWIAVETLVGDTVRLNRVVPSEADEAFDVLGISELSTALFVLACVPGRCPIIERARGVLAAGASDLDFALDMADPGRWMADLPIDGVSLAGREFVVSRSFEGRNTNPIVEARFPEREDDPIEVAAGGDQEFAFLAEDSDEDRIYAYAYTTLGRFEERRERSYDGVVRHYLLAPDGPAQGRVYIVFEDGEGGAALWAASVAVP